MFERHDMKGCVVKQEARSMTVGVHPGPHTYHKGNYIKKSHSKTRDTSKNNRSHNGVHETPLHGDHKRKKHRARNIAP
jgi:hypothetical protein